MQVSALVVVFVAFVSNNNSAGISPPRAQKRRLAERTAKGRGAVDRTNYGLTRRSTRSFEVHHKQRMSAVKNDAMAIRKQAAALAKKQLLCMHPSVGRWPCPTTRMQSMLLGV